MNTMTKICRVVSTCIDGLDILLEEVLRFLFTWPRDLRRTGRIVFLCTAPLASMLYVTGILLTIGITVVGVAVILPALTIRGAIRWAVQDDTVNYLGGSEE